MLAECYGAEAAFSVTDICPPANQVTAEPFIARCCRSERAGIGVHDGYYGAVVHWGGPPPPNHRRGSLCHLCRLGRKKIERKGRKGGRKGGDQK
ncbi:hypothetical protein [Methanogenium cariaci]|uniref:DUF7714 family protein n=1 Tax=Methanogenium cariaci TaxID=2197 RepID=UPI00158154FF|nr:hypothetical protein [Methanogenium cariaci]